MWTDGPKLYQERMEVLELLDDFFLGLFRCFQVPDSVRAKGYAHGLQLQSMLTARYRSSKKNLPAETLRLVEGPSAKMGRKLGSFIWGWFTALYICVGIKAPCLTEKFYFHSHSV